MEPVIALTKAILTNPLVLLFALLTVAYGADRLLKADGRLLPIIILIVAPTIGWLAEYELPAEIRTLGLIMFIYVIGVETGSEFFPTFRRHWRLFGLLGLLASGVAASLAWACARALGWSPETAVAFYAGAVTNTPAFSWLPDLLGETGLSDVAAVTATFDLSYFAGVIAAVVGVIFFHFIWTHRSGDASCPVSFPAEEQAVSAPYFVSVHRCTNRTIFGKPLTEVMTGGVPEGQAIRVERDGVVSEVAEGTLCGEGDLIVIIGCTPGLTRMAEVLVGPAAEITDDAPLVRDLPVRFDSVTVNSPRFTMRPIVEEEVKTEYGVEVRGWWRGREYHAVGPTMRWRVGDRLRVLGTEEKVKAFRHEVEETGQAQTEEIDLLRFSVGAVAAMLLSGIVVPVGYLRLTFGVSGAPLLAGLLFGRSAQIRIPRGAAFFVKELGLGLFLAGVGTNVGLRGALSPSDLLLLPLAVIVVAVPMVMTAVWLKYRRFSGQHAEGGVCGAASSTTALMVSCRLNETAEPANTYAGIYLFALLAGVAAAQILYAMV